MSAVRCIQASFFASMVIVALIFAAGSVGRPTPRTRRTPLRTSRICRRLRKSIR